MNHLIRQHDLIPMDILDTEITIIGAGAIGSMTTLALAKMGFHSIHVIDFDEVSVENMNSQFYRFSDIGKKKVVALQNLIKDFTDIEIKITDGEYKGGTFNGILIKAVDSMRVRKLIFDEHNHTNFGTRFIIDPRMGAETAQLHVYNPMKQDDVNGYEKKLYTDDNSIQERCTAKATMYTALMLSGFVAKAVKDVLTGVYVREAHWSLAEHDLVVMKSDGTGTFGDMTPIASLITQVEGVPVTRLDAARGWVGLPPGTVLQGTMPNPAIQPDFAERLRRVTEDGFASARGLFVDDAQGIRGEWDGIVESSDSTDIVNLPL